MDTQKIVMTMLIGWGPSAIQEYAKARGFAITAILLIILFWIGIGMIPFLGITSFGPILAVASYVAYMLVGMLYLGAQHHREE